MMPRDIFMQQLSKALSVEREEGELEIGTVLTSRHGAELTRA